MNLVTPLGQRSWGVGVGVGGVWVELESRKSVGLGSGVGFGSLGLGKLGSGLGKLEGEYGRSGELSWGSGVRDWVGWGRGDWG